jgi:hypothetical protein
MKEFYIPFQQRSLYCWQFKKLLLCQLETVFLSPCKWILKEPFYDWHEDAYSLNFLGIISRNFFRNITFHKFGNRETFLSSNIFSEDERILYTFSAAPPLVYGNGKESTVNRALDGSTYPG